MDRFDWLVRFSSVGFGLVWFGLVGWLVVWFLEFERSVSIGWLMCFVRFDWLVRFVGLLDCLLDVLGFASFRLVGFDWFLDSSAWVSSFSSGWLAWSLDSSALGFDRLVDWFGSFFLVGYAVVLIGPLILVLHFHWLIGSVRSDWLVV